MFHGACGVTPATSTSPYVGVSFFHSTDRNEVHTSVAQVFDERGDGVVVRGGPVARNKQDRQPPASGSTPKPPTRRFYSRPRDTRGTPTTRVSYCVSWIMVVKSKPSDMIRVLSVAIPVSNTASQ